MQRCTGIPTLLSQAFPGVCVAAADPAALGACAEGVARGVFHEMLAGADALSIDCDLTDDGAGNLSCESTELREHVLNRLGYGPDAWTRSRIQTLGVAGYIQEQLDWQTHRRQRARHRADAVPEPVDDVPAAARQLRQQPRAARSWARPSSRAS